MIKKCLFVPVWFFLITGFVFSQDENTTKNVEKPVRAPFESEVLIDNQTGVVPDKNTLEFLIQHRFGMMGNGFSDLFGIYAPGANIRLSLNYIILKNLQLGYGLTKKNMYSDFYAKYALLEQTRSGSMPVAVTLYGNVALDGRDDEVFGVNYKFTNRASYFGQIIIGRKFTGWLSLQLTTSFSHFNSVAKNMDHDKMGAGINGRIKFSPMSSFLFQYDIPLDIKSLEDHLTPTTPSKPNLGFGYEVSSGLHAFQIYVTTASGILPQDVYLYNQNDFTKGDLMFGFSITRLWGF